MYEKVYGTWDHHTLNGVQYASSVRWCGHILWTCFVVLQPALRGLGIVVSWGCTDTFGSFLRWATDSMVKTRIWVLGEYIWRGGCPLRTNNKIRDGGKLSIDRNFRSNQHRDRMKFQFRSRFDRSNCPMSIRSKCDAIAIPELLSYP